MIWIFSSLLLPSNIKKYDDKYPRKIFTNPHFLNFKISWNRSYQLQSRCNQASCLYYSQQKKTCQKSSPNNLRWTLTFFKFILFHWGPPTKRMMENKDSTKKEQAKQKHGGSISSQNSHGVHGCIQTIFGIKLSQ